MELRITQLTLAIATLLPVGLSYGAGIDRSTQPSWGFVQDGTFAYVESISINPTVDGKDMSGNKVPNMTNEHRFLNFGVKADVNDSLSLGVYYDEPWGADAEFKGNNNYTNPIANSVERDSTKVIVKSRNFSGVAGIKLGENKNFQIYGGPVLQKLNADVALRGNAFTSLNGYDFKFNDNNDMGWLAGVAFTKPEIALKASLTYRSEIDHHVKAQENIPVLAKFGKPTAQTADMTLTTPESVNLDFQTGLNQTTLLTAKARWVPWSKFVVKPPLLNNTVKALTQQDLPLLTYSDDAWTTELGLVKKLSDKLAVSGSVGWDSGAGNPVSTLGPVEGNKNVGIGARYAVTPEWAISAGAKYLMFGDATGVSSSGAVLGNFDDNDGWVYGLRLTYQKK